MARPKKGRKVALVAGLALVVLSVAMVWTYWEEIRSWYALWRDFEALGKNAQGYPEYRHRQTGMVMVGLPGGTFEMGSPETEPDRVDNEGPVHKVTLSPFLIAKYEVSQAEWKGVMGVNPSGFKGDALPVVNPSWEACQEFCTKTGLSLPTEAQWEYACRAGTSGAYAARGKLDETAWYSDDPMAFRFLGAHPVGEKQPNGFGIHDMHGNVWEWCEDWYQNDFYQESTDARDPLCENSGSRERVIRGGGWQSISMHCRSAFRGAGRRSGRGGSLGFRPAVALRRA